jgi:hypothetical protein
LNSKTNFDTLEYDFEALESGFEVLESGFKADHDNFKWVWRRGIVKPTTGVVGESPQIWLGWPATPHMVDGGGLRRQHWCPTEASGGSNVCERNNLVFCSHIFFLQFSSMIMCQTLSGLHKILVLCNDHTEEDALKKEKGALVFSIYTCEKP